MLKRASMMTAVLLGIISAPAASVAATSCSGAELFYYVPCRICRLDLAPHELCVAGMYIAKLLSATHQSFSSG